MNSYRQLTADQWYTIEDMRANGRMYRPPGI